jgi:hypothetical protein
MRQDQGQSGPKDQKTKWTGAERVGSTKREKRRESAGAIAMRGWRRADGISRQREARVYRQLTISAKEKQRRWWLAVAQGLKKKRPLVAEAQGVEER